MFLGPSETDRYKILICKRYKGLLINPLSITIPWSTVDKEPELDRTDPGFNFFLLNMSLESFTEAYFFYWTLFLHSSISFSSFALSCLFSFSAKVLFTYQTKGLEYIMFQFSRGICRCSRLIILITFLIGHSRSNTLVFLLSPWTPREGNELPRKSHNSTKTEQKRRHQHMKDSKLLVWGGFFFFF